MTIFDRTVKVFQEALECDPSHITTETVPEDIPTWDSMGQMSLVSALESEFGQEFEIDDIMEMSSIAKILEILEEKGVTD